MMRRPWHWECLAALSIAAGLATSGPAGAGSVSLPEPATGWRAHGVVEIGGERIAMEIWHEDEKERQELVLEGLRQTTILRADLGRAYVVTGPDREVFAMPIAEIGALPVSVGLADYEAVLESRETLGNEAVGRYAVIGEDRTGQSVDATIWITPDGIPVRAEGEVSGTGDTVDFTFQLDLIRRGDQPDHLFVPPGGLDTSP